MASMNEVIEGLKVLSKYHDPDDSNGVCAEHDIIYSMPELLDGESGIEAADRARLDKLGWHFDTANACWACFV